MTTKEITIEGMSCHHCVMAVQKELANLSVARGNCLESFDVKIGSAKVTFDESKIKIEDINKAIEKAGYTVAGYSVKD